MTFLKVNHVHSCAAHLTFYLCLETPFTSFVRESAITLAQELTFAHLSQISSVTDTKLNRSIQQHAKWDKYTLMRPHSLFLLAYSHRDRPRTLRQANNINSHRPPWIQKAAQDC